MGHLYHGYVSHNQRVYPLFVAIKFNPHLLLKTRSHKQEPKKNLRCRCATWKAHCARMAGRAQHEDNWVGSPAVNVPPTTGGIFPMQNPAVWLCFSPKKLDIWKKWSFFQEKARCWRVDSAEHPLVELEGSQVHINYAMISTIIVFTISRKNFTHVF